jgi:hypothetical protein
MTKNSGGGQWFIPQMCNISTSNILYFLLLKNNKCVILVFIFSNLQILSDFLFFCVAYNTNNFIFKIYMLADYDYVWIFFHIFLKLINMIVNFFKTMKLLMPKSLKHFLIIQPNHQRVFSETNYRERSQLS